MKHKTITVQVRPCPCCGSVDLDVGIQSAQTYGVQCRSCRLLMERSSPGKWPKGVWKRNLTEEQNWERLYTWVVQQAVGAWNARAQPAEVGCKATIRI